MVNNGMLRLLGSSPSSRCVCREMPPGRAARELALAPRLLSEQAKAIPVVPPVVARSVPI
jgi:hypothetical protein